MVTHLQRMVDSQQLSTEQAIEALRQQMLRNWWLITLGLWLTIGVWSLWQFRSEFQLWTQYFTWTAVRYSLAYNRLASIGFGLCFGMTFALLISESRHLLVGLSQRERERLERQLNRIRQQGPTHPLWRVVHPTNPD